MTRVQFRHILDLVTTRNFIGVGYKGKFQKQEYTVDKTRISFSVNQI